MINIDEFQKAAKDNVDTAIKSVGTTTKGLQAIAAEVSDYSKRSFEQGTAALEKVFGAKTLDKAIEAQTEYLKASYEGAVAQATKVNSLYANLAKELYKPYEAAFGKFAAFGK
jgi:hypothetical protein